ncbi:MAG: winged helix-turn-helix transcriptional regulator [Thermoplasmatota archaeon]
MMRLFACGALLALIAGVGVAAAPIPLPDVSLHGLDQAAVPPVPGSGSLPGGGNGAPGAPGIGQPIGDGVGAGFAAWSVASVAAALAGAAGFLLVTRYVSPKEALKNPQRAMLYGFVRGNPGVHLKRLGDEFAMKTSSILWHIRKLEAADLVHSERSNGFRVFYPVDGGIEVKRVSRGIAALQNTSARRLFECVEKQPGQSPQGLAQQLGIHVGTVRWHLRKLREFGLVEELVREEGSLHYPTPLGRRTLGTLLGTPPIPVVAPLLPVALPVDE